MADRQWRLTWPQKYPTGDRTITSGGLHVPRGQGRSIHDICSARETIVRIRPPHNSIIPRSKKLHIPPAIPANAPMYDFATRFRAYSGGSGGSGVQSRRFRGRSRAWRELLTFHCLPKVLSRWPDPSLPRYRCVWIRAFGTSNLHVSHCHAVPTRPIPAVGHSMSAWEHGVKWPCCLPENEQDDAH